MCARAHKNNTWGTAAVDYYYIRIGASRPFAFYVAVTLVARAHTHTHHQHIVLMPTQCFVMQCAYYTRIIKNIKNWPATVRRRPRAVK